VSVAIGLLETEHAAKNAVTTADCHRRVQE
jgi:hypothetical protein